MEIELTALKPRLIITRGVSNSGKSTWAREWVDEDPANRRRVNRDEIRKVGLNVPNHSGDEELLITSFQHAFIMLHLRAGREVVVDDMHLRPSYIRPYHFMLKRINEELGTDAKLEFKEFPMDLETAIARAKKRAEDGGLEVPEEGIVRMFEKYTNKGKLIELPDFDAPAKGSRRSILLELEPYIADLSKPLAIIVDIDGTLTLGIHPDRSPYEWDKVGLDLPNEHVIYIVRMMHMNGHKVLITSGRDGVCRPETIEWLNRHNIPFDELFMREEGDMVGDDVVKAEIFNESIRDNYNIRAVFDDRLRVVRIWHALGLPLFRIGDPDASF
jgi:predicted kinase